MLVADLLSALKQRGFSPQLWPAQPALLDVELAAACFDSRRVQSKDLFCAIDGEKCNGVDYVDSAVSNGAALSLVQELQPDITTPQIIVSDSLAEVAAHCSDILAASPSYDMWCAAVTGTNGKTTVAHLLRGALTDVAISAASCGTLGMIDASGTLATLNTTPSADLIHNWLKSLQSTNCESVVLEASSHGIVQQRLAAIDFDCLAFTNLSREHLDYHKSMNNYAEAKTSLVHRLNASAVAFIPHDPLLLDLCSDASCTVQSWSSCDTSADHFCSIDADDKGVTVSFQWQQQPLTIESELTGYHNGENIFLAALMMLSRGVAVEQVAVALAKQSSADGRLQQVPIHRGTAYVDYAHTPDALEKVLLSLRASHPNARLKVVFGAGGDRDNSKRAPMGRAVSEYADWCVLTSDNPRSEDPRLIIDQVAAGIDVDSIEYQCVVDRAAAIRLAVESMSDNDVLVVAGKGHETYQEINGTRTDFDDRVEIREASKCLA